MYPAAGYHAPEGAYDDEQYEVAYDGFQGGAWPPAGYHPGYAAYQAAYPAGAAGYYAAAGSRVAAGGRSSGTGSSS
ncbi:hypothetical protein C2E21_3423 [Chlorella sorokiniana]|uniref:Uncharacterized protein n=1 Tax=Chlorella sorokiniana TaxID=3076 RepID=A0A2P6TVI8_CHLSO|nr:hypothetical protein C2E21_3423 [Chlorella sorokiniana]|eukprot:PRW58074.1 hypothetical protein C2E21_3423 [Chlorella sorokiniana]